MTSTIYFLGETIELQCTISWKDLALEEAVYIQPYEGENPPLPFSRAALEDYKVTYPDGLRPDTNQAFKVTQIRPYKEWLGAKETQELEHCE